LGKGSCRCYSSQMEAASKDSFTEIKNAHVVDYQSLFKRVSIDLGSGAGNYSQRCKDHRHAERVYRY